jgi:hypothetical protein
MEGLRLRSFPVLTSFFDDLSFGNIRLSIVLSLLALCAGCALPQRDYSGPPNNNSRRDSDAFTVYPNDLHWNDARRERLQELANRNEAFAVVSIPKRDREYMARLSFVLESGTIGEAQQLSSFIQLILDRYRGTEGLFSDDRLLLTRYSFDCDALLVRILELRYESVI